jgi:hypothetical protein
MTEEDQDLDLKTERKRKATDIEVKAVRVDIIKRKVLL